MLAGGQWTWQAQGMIADRVLFIDAEALVIDKPSGLAIHPGSRTPASLENHLDALRFGFQRRPSPVHRLDRDTSGCLLLARHPKAHRRFALAFEEGRVEKLYWAVLEGVPGAATGRIDLPLAKRSSREAGWRMVHDPKGKPAVTDWELLAVRGERALVAFRPQNGRTHQIRVHAASGLGVPILGDPVYGAGGNGETLLHARGLTLQRDGKAPIEAVAPMPARFSMLGFAEEAGD